MKRPAISLVGVGDDGCAGLPSRAINAIARAQVLVGGERHLRFFPDFAGERITLRGGLEPTLSAVIQLSEDNNVCILASGDPMFFGIGAKLIARVGAENVQVLPQPSSVQLAFARAGVSWESARLLSVHGRSLSGLASRLRHCASAAILTCSKNTPAVVAAHLCRYGQSHFDAWVCENLGGPGERVRAMPLAQLALVEDAAPLNVVVLRRCADSPEQQPALLPFVPDSAFAKRTPKLGLITKREVRALSLAHLNLRRDSVLWDVGAGSGSVAIEAALMCSEGRAIAVEVDPEGVALCRQNALAFGADNVEVVEGLAPSALEGLEAPDAVFVGGSKGNLAAIVDVALARLRPGGRLVINAIALESVAEAHSALKAHAVETDIALVQVSRGVPLARYRRLEALNPIHIFAARKPEATAP